MKPSGYGSFSPQMGKTFIAHRFAYELLVGPIPEGLTLDHIKANGCTSTACVKAIADERGPAHLEPVPFSENRRRALKTHCKRGHPFDEANTYRKRNGHRTCRICDALRTRNARRQFLPVARAAARS